MEKTIKKSHCIFDFGGYASEPHHHRVNQWADIYKTEDNEHFVGIHDSERNIRQLYRLNKREYKNLKGKTINGEDFEALSKLEVAENVVLEDN